MEQIHGFKPQKAEYSPAKKMQLPSFI
jgi:hypothetical protein